MRKAPRKNPFEGFKHVCLFGLGLGGVDAEIRTGLTKFRGLSHKWLMHDLGRYSEQLHKVEAGSLECDVLVGYVNSETHAERLKRLGKPVLDLYQEFELPEWRTHGIDFKAVGQMGAQYFLGLKHRSFAFLSLRDTRTDRLVWEGFREVLAGKSERLVWIQREAEQMVEVTPKEQIRPYPSHGDRLAALPRPTAMLAHSDGTAASVATLAFFMGISVPEELSILGIGNMSPICDSCHPALTSIQLPGEKLGYLVGEHLKSFLEGDSLKRFSKLPPLLIVQRKSTGMDAVRDPVVAKALALMRHTATSRMTIGEIAAQLPISKRGFNERFTRVVGRTPREELERIRLGIARERLLSTNDTVLHVALDCGFADVDSMVRSFKKQLGLTPTQFRQQNRI
jgi:LacI family transcriptional regulator